MGYARFGSRLAREVVEISHDVQCLDKGGFWAVVVTFEGDVTCVRFGQVVDLQVSDPQPTGEPPCQVPDWAPLTGNWSTSLDWTAYRSGVTQIRDHIAAGEVYQACLCRVMSHPLTDDADLTSLETLVAQGNPAPHAGRICVPEAGLDLLSASPEAFLIRHGGRIESRPIKGTATTLSAMLVKDYAENVMITDLVRNDLSTRIGVGGAQVVGASGHRGPGECAAGSLLWGDRVGGRGLGRGRACRGHSHVLGGSGRLGAAHAEIRHRRRNHVGF